MNHTAHIASRLALKDSQVESAITLFKSGATIPFIARYRKDETGGLDDVNLIQVDEQWKNLMAIDERRSAIIEALRKKEVLTPDLQRDLNAANSLTELEDIYLPFKTKRQSRAEKARQAGFEPLAKMLMAQGDGDPEQMAQRFVKKPVQSADEALSGAVDIMAEWMNEDIWLRRRLRQVFHRDSTIATSVLKGKEGEGARFRDYFDYQEPVTKIKPHRMLAVFRGEKEGFLRLSMAPERERVLQIMEGTFVRNPKSPAAIWVLKAIAESYSRLLRPALQNELKLSLKETADKSAIEVFTSNLRQLLMAPPLGAERVLAIDPGFKSGCKVVCLNEQGQLLGHDTIYPHAPQRKSNPARNTLHSLIKSHDIRVIAIGNGTAGRETETFIKQTAFNRELKVFMVNEDGASVYSASSVGRKEFPNHDVTIRGAVSIGRRLMDPLAELVKIDPRSIGVGQYQHDVNENKLVEALNLCVQLVVNEVGVELNTASPYLLAHISGLTPALADNIVSYRNENGPFRSRNEILKVKGLGPKAFEQCAGFLRIADSDNPLDNTAVHPESYELVKTLARMLKSDVGQLIENQTLLASVKSADLKHTGVGEMTVSQILSELSKPHRDPRRTAYVVNFDKKITRPEDLILGSEMWGIVTNITSFGAFVDIGVKQDGLVHISELADRFVSDPFEVVRISQPVKVKIVSVDMERKRIALSMKQATILHPPV